MALELLAHDQILREVVAGTGATFPTETDGGLGGDRSDGHAAEVLGPRRWPSHARVNFRSLWFSLCISGVAGGAVVIAALALSIAYRNIDELDLIRERIVSLDTGLSSLPALQKDFEGIAVEQVRMREANQAQLAALQSSNDTVAKVAEGLRQSIDFVDQALEKAIDKSEQRENSLGLRLEKIEGVQTALAASGPRREGVRRITAEDAPSAATFRLLRIDDDVATLKAPSGSILVSVGADVPGLGRILKIGKQGRNGVIVAANRTLSAPWSQVAANSEPLPLDIEHDSIQVPSMAEAGPANSGKRKRFHGVGSNTKSLN
jgi:hypothetical protein